MSGPHNPYGRRSPPRGTPRSQWDPETLTEEPYDMEIVRAEFARAEAAAHSTSA